MPKYTKTAIITADAPRVVGHFTIRTFLANSTGNVVPIEKEGREGITWHAVYWQHMTNGEPQAFIIPPLLEVGFSLEQEAADEAQNRIEASINQNRDLSSLIFLFD